MLDNIAALRQAIEADLATINDLDSAEAFRLKHLVKKGSLNALTQEFKAVPREEKAAVGKALNELKNWVTESFDAAMQAFKREADDAQTVDVTLPGRRPYIGAQHPTNAMIREITRIFSALGFDAAEGPEIEDEKHNFDDLNFPPNHPARDMQDTFFVKDENRNLVLRTHTSPVQIRLMQSRKPPIRCIVPGRVYRNEATDATHLAEFHQVEGLYVDRKVSMADLKGTLYTFFSELFQDPSLKFRLRPSFFPFTEPSAEVDVFVDDARGARWIELAGCGMVHPNVLRNCDIDPEEYSGFAFGFGIERLIMPRRKITDIRMLYENDIRVLHQLT